MKFKVTWQLLWECGSFFDNSFSVIYETHNAECPDKI